MFAQAAHARFVYIAQEAPSPDAQAIIVKRDRPLHTVADLKGQRIAVTKAAGSHYLLLAALSKAGLTPADVRISYLAPADGRAAFGRGSVDAWVTWDPYVASVERVPDVRILANGEGIASYQRYYLASSSFAAAHPDVINTVFAQLTSAGVWVRAHPDEAAKLLAPIWGLDAATTGRANARRRAAEFRRAAEDRRHLLSRGSAAGAGGYGCGVAVELHHEAGRSGGYFGYCFGWVDRCVVRLNPLARCAGDVSVGVGRDNG
ncbi:hypothetical protein R54767_00079 [Paraburkholderia gardini]|uniref:SsuA/THI5-like domain-containing protein n=1 Tax=Paraburkholderia gardini TaxID=2823469 RepID=A0ABN7QF40_9BURK|nr:hypothetical protein R54767_00079 [Paraburkholderia gardini]